ncbi:MAG: iron-containing redox enzyme family protein, partial [Nitrosospira sp.]
MGNVAHANSCHTLTWPGLHAGALAMRARPVYLGLLNERCNDHHQIDELALRSSHVFLSRKLEAASKLICDLPDHVQLLPSWIERSADHTGRQYQAYLAIRKAGGDRRYFSSKSHALYFLRSVAPTKLVDGAWLYGLLRRWNDARFAPLIRIYLEELGGGLPDKNHVLLYRKLLA